MPCLFFRNVPAGVEFDPVECDKLYRRIAVAAKTSIRDIELHFEDTRYELLGQDGKLRPHDGVHVFVEWFGRPEETKDQVAEAIHQFLFHYGLGRDSNITFRDYHGGAFYHEGIRVPGGLPRGWV